MLGCRFANTAVVRETRFAAADVMLGDRERRMSYCVALGTACQANTKLDEDAVAVTFAGAADVPGGGSVDITTVWLHVEMGAPAALMARTRA